MGPGGKASCQIRPAACFPLVYLNFLTHWFPAPNFSSPSSHYTLKNRFKFHQLLHHHTIKSSIPSSWVTADAPLLAPATAALAALAPTAL